MADRFLDHEKVPEEVARMHCQRMEPASDEEKASFAYWAYPAFLALAMLMAGVLCGSHGCSAVSSCAARQGQVSLVMLGILLAVGLSGVAFAWMRSFVFNPVGIGFFKALAAALLAGAAAGICIVH